MARVIDRLPDMERGTKGESKYPVAEWLDGRAWMIFQGEDYPCGHPSITQILRRQSIARGGVLRTRALREGGEQIGWAIQFVPRDSERNAS